MARLRDLCRLAGPHSHLDGDGLKTDLTDYFIYTIGPLTLLYIGYEMTKCTPDERKKLAAAVVFVLFSVIFWAFFEQSGGSLSLFAANNLDDTLLGIKVDPNGVNNSSNSLFVIAFSPLLGLLWVALAKKKREPNTVVKFGLGFLFLAAAFYVFYATRFFADARGITSLDVFTTAYLIITLGELCLSPIDLSIMTKLSPRPLQGVMMGMWFLASAYGQYVAGLPGPECPPTPDASAMDKLTRTRLATSNWASMRSSPAWCSRHFALGAQADGRGEAVVSSRMNEHCSSAHRARCCLQVRKRFREPSDAGLDAGFDAGSTRVSTLGSTWVSTLAPAGRAREIYSSRQESDEGPSQRN